MLFAVRGHVRDSAALKNILVVSSVHCQCGPPPELGFLDNGIPEPGKKHIIFLEDIEWVIFTWRPDLQPSQRRGPDI